MKIILFKDIHNLGKKWDIKDVSEGYARNFLMPKNLALQATLENLNKRNQWIKDEERELKSIKKTSEKLAEEKIEFKVKTGERGEVFGSVTKEDIKKELLKRNYEIYQIKLERPIKKTGETKVGITFKYGIKGFVIINII